MQTVRSLIQLLAKGYSLRGIARELHLSRKTVTQYVSRLQNSAYSTEALRLLDDALLASIVYTPASSPLISADIRKEDMLSQMGYFNAELKRTGVTRLTLWEEYRKENPQGYSYTQFCVLLSAYRKTGEATMHISHTPAEVVMVDFAGDKMSYIDKASGELIECPVLVCVLPYSDFGFAIALPNATIPQVIKGLNACLDYFGGVPLSLKTDNMKQVVIKTCRYEPSFTEVLQQWAIHNNITLLTARVAKPRDKGSVENGVKIIYRRIYAPLRNERFFSLEQLNAAITLSLSTHNNKLFQRKDYSRAVCFDKEEKPLLQSLPPDSFVLKHRVQAKVQKNYHVTLGEDWHHYSVPYGLIGKIITAVYDSNCVELYHQFQRIALHKRSYKKHGYTTVKEHMPQGHQHYFEQRGWTGDYFLQQAQKTGPAAYKYVEGILAGKHFTEQTYNACRGLLRLTKEYGSGRLEAACARALQGDAYTYRIIHNILKNNQDKQPSDQGDLFKMPSHNNLRGPDAYQ